MNLSPSFKDQNSIEYIRKKLWCGQEFGQVALMIGSGFSRNAERISQDTPPFPLWSDLCQVILRATHPNGSLSKLEYDKKIQQLIKESDPLQVAQDFQDLFGSSALDELLIQAIPDLQYIPGNLHTLMLTLPWSDVFTTNYDTLLERTLPKVYERKYDIVSTIYDIPQKMKPRIVKLHGSFPSYRPFIISRNEYKEYPERFAPFTNIVRQSIMENTFCLIGFSSDDPNFKQWKDWVYENLREYQPHIYLCGILDLTENKRKKLLIENITPIDLGPLFPKNEWIDPDLRHKNALEWFALNLMYGAPQNPMRWPSPSEKTHWKPSNQMIPEIPPGPPRLPELNFSFLESSNLTVAQLEEVNQKWKNQREYYPGWTIAPYDNRKNLLEYTLRWVNGVLNSINNIPPPQDIFLLSELNWRIETSLIPVFSNWAEIYEQILLSYNPYPKLVKNEKGIYTPDHTEYKEFDWNTIGKYWVNLIFPLIREDRWDQKHEKFQFWIDLIEQVVKLNTDWYLRWYYEKCLYSLSKFDQINLRQLLKNWPKYHNLPFFEVKRAALLAELGELNEAKEITEKALSDIRLKLHSNPDNFLFLSQEGWTMLLLQSIQYEELVLSKKYSEALNVRSKFRDRWDRIAIFNSNPWQEVEKLQFILNNDLPSELPEYTTNMEFDPGKTTHTYHLFSSSSFERRTPAFAFIRIFEDVGLPVNCGPMSMFHETLLNAAKWIEPYSSPWAISMMIRTGNEKGVGEFFNRSRIVLMTDDQINSHFILLSVSLKQSLENLGDIGLESIKEKSFSNLQVKITTELLSRLAFRLSKKQIDELLNIANELYLWNIKNQNVDFYRSLNNLYKRTLYSMRDLEIVERLKLLLDLPIFDPLNNQHQSHYYLADPFSFIEWNQNTIIPEKIRLDLTNNITKLLDLVEKGTINNRTRAIHRLSKLYQIKGLSQIEEEIFGKALWARCDPNTGLPSETDLYDTSFLYMPEPEPGIAHEKVKLYLYSMDIPKTFTSTVSTNGKSTVSTSTGSGFIDYVYKWGNVTTPIDLNTGENIEKSIDWTADEAFNLLLKIQKIWDEDKSNIIKYRENNKSWDFFKSNSDQEIWGILELLRIVILPRFLKMGKPEAKQIIKELFDEMESNNICINSLIALQIMVEPEKYKEKSSKLRKGLISLNENENQNSVLGLFYWIALSEQKLVKTPPQDFISEIINQITNRRQPNLKYNLSMISSLISQYPKYLSPKQIDSLCLALEYLLTETEIKLSRDLEQSSVIPIINRPEFRRLSARLAFTLFNYFSHNPELIPDVILRWKKTGMTDPLPEVWREWKLA